MASWQRRTRVERLAALPPEDRLALAKEGLQQARLELLSAQALLDDARSLSVLDILGLAIDRGRGKQSSAGAAARHVRTAQQLVTEALEAWPLGVAVGEPADWDTDAVMLEADTAWLTDGLATDIAAHMRIRRARRQVPAMLSRIEELLSSLSRASAVSRC